MTDTVNILLATSTVDVPDHRIVAVPEDHPAVAFCARWAKAGSAAFIDLGDDKPDLLAMWAELDDLPEVALPCTVHHVIHGITY